VCPEWQQSYFGDGKFKLEARNQMTKIQNKQLVRFRLLENSDFEFVSDFDIRISDFFTSKSLLGSDEAGLGT
jgi:hypothetical protein